MKFRKKPVVIEAMLFDGTKHTGYEILKWAGPNCGMEYVQTPIFGIMRINTLKGVMSAGIGDWIIKGVNGEFYPCEPDIFEATYEKAVLLEPDTIQVPRELWEKISEALKFYADENKYFIRKRVINLQQTTAVFKVDDPSKLPTEYESEVFECSVRIKVDQGKKAREALRDIEGGER